MIVPGPGRSPSPNNKSKRIPRKNKATVTITPQKRKSMKMIDPTHQTKRRMITSKIDQIYYIYLFIFINNINNNNIII